MNINNIQADRSQVENALKFVIEGDTFKEAARQVGVSGRTVQNWSNAGLLTDGEKWTDVRKKHEHVTAMSDRQGALDVKIEDTKEWQEDVVTNIRNAIREGMQHIVDNPEELSPNDIEVLEKVERRVGSRAEEVQALLNRAMRQWFRAAREVLSRPQFEELVMEKKRVELDMLEEINPEAAKQLVEDTSPKMQDYDN